MQDKYVGDVGDFGKYALLRRMQIDFDLSLGVVWYLADPVHTDGEHQANDGKHIGYLGLKISNLDGQLLPIILSKDSKKLRERYVELYEKLKSIVVDRKRSVQSIKTEAVLGNRVVFFDKCLSNPTNISPDKRKTLRERWLKDAIAATRTQDIVFLDPDNGLSSEKRIGRKVDDAKYVLWTELDEFWGDGKRILVVYHHPNRKDKGISHDEQITNLLAEIEKRPVFINAKVFPLRYRRGTSRAYFVIVPKEKANQWKNWLHEFVKPWPEKKSKDEMIKAFEFTNSK